MKKIIKVIGIILFSTFMLIPLKANAATSEWSQSLDLSDSVSSAIVKVEDGVVVMQYEGTASVNNLLIKYDFKGNEIKKKDNIYGYNITSISDGFIVWSEKKITKFDKDLNEVWSKQIEYKGREVGGLGDNLVEFEDGYIIGPQISSDSPKRDIFKISLQGEILQRKSAYDFINNLYGHVGEYCIITFGKSLDGNSLIMIGRDIYNGQDNLNFSWVSSDLTPQTTYSNNITDADSNFTVSVDGYHRTNIIATDSGYLLTGCKLLTFDSNGRLNKKYNKLLFNLIQIDDYIYGYQVEKGNKETIGTSTMYKYKTSIVKYDKSLNEISRITLPFSVGFYYSGATAITSIKDRVIYYLNNEEIHFITLNAPYKYIKRHVWNDNLSIYGDNFVDYEGTYELASYRYTDNDRQTDDVNNIPGIIDNIIKNPQTNSILIVAVFVVLILVISITSYLIYKKKIKKEEIKK